MKKLLFFILVTIIFSYKSYSQEVQTKKEVLTKEVLLSNQPKSNPIKFKEGALKIEFIKGVKKDKNKSLMVDYGKIIKGSNGERTILFKNTGRFPIIIQKIDTSCGCTIPKWSKIPILPGELGQIIVKYDTQRIGKFSKNINVLILSGRKGKKEYEVIFQIGGIVLGDKIEATALNKNID